MKSLQSVLREIIDMKQIFNFAHSPLPPVITEVIVFRVAVIEVVLVVVDMSGCFWDPTVVTIVAYSLSLALSLSVSI